MKNPIFILMVTLCFLTIFFESKSYAQTSFCDNSINTDSLIGKKVTLKMLPIKYNKNNELLFEPSIHKNLLKDYTLLTDDLLNKEAQIIKISKRVNLYKQASRFYVLKYKDFYISVDCSYLKNSETKCSKCECEEENAFLSIQHLNTHPITRNCFIRKQNQAFPFGYSDFICYSCSLDFNKEKPILTIQRETHGYARSNPASFVFWENKGQIQIKAFYNNLNYKEPHDKKETKFIKNTGDNIDIPGLFNYLSNLKNQNPRKLSKHFYNIILLDKNGNVKRIRMHEKIFEDELKINENNKYLQLIWRLIKDNNQWANE